VPQFVLGQAPADQSADSALAASTDDKPVPILSGSAGFITPFDNDEPHLGPIVSPVVLVPLGQRWLFESRGTF